MRRGIRCLPEFGGNITLHFVRIKSWISNFVNSLYQLRGEYPYPMLRRALASERRPDPEG